MASVPSLLSGFLFLFFLLCLNLGLLHCCFAPAPAPARADHTKTKTKTKTKGKTRTKKKFMPSLGLSLASVRSRLVSHSINQNHQSPAAAAAAVAKTDTLERKHVHVHVHGHGGSFACSLCGEVFCKPHLLDLHQATNHSLSELSHSDSEAVLRIIFLSSWKGKGKRGGLVEVRRIFKIHHNQHTLARFEDYRDLIRSRASRRRCTDGNERCVADGNERLRFYCCTMLCSLGAGAVCASPYCCICGILRHGFSGKQGGITTFSSGWGAHASLPEEVERDFAFLQVRRAMLVCRVVAGRVARGGEAELVDLRRAGAANSMFDSVASTSGSGSGDDDELLVFNPKAVLPCFVILYSSSSLLT